MNNISLSAFAPENLVSRDGFSSPVPRQPAHLHIQAESGSYLRNSSRVPRRRPLCFLCTLKMIYITVALISQSLGTGPTCTEREVLCTVQELPKPS